MDPEQQSSQSRCKKMTVEQVRRLIAARVECNNLFTTKFFDRKAAWRTIQEKAGLNQFTPDQLKIKWANLTRKYKLLIAPPTGGATENGEQTPDEWEHFAQLHDFMSRQHTINPPLVVNSCGVVVENSTNTSQRSGRSQDDDDMMDAGPSTSPREYFSSPESVIPSQQTSEEHPEREKKKRNRYSQQDMFEYFVEESKRKKKEGKKFFTLLKCIAESQNVNLPNFDSSSSDSDFDM